jgi:hypothetical protein
MTKPQMILALLIGVLIGRMPIAMAMDRTYGIGLAFGDPSTVTGKYWIDSDSAIVGGFAFLTDKYTLLYSDYHHHLKGLIQQAELQDFTPYIGLGGIVVRSTGSRSAKRKFLGESSGDLGLAMRVPVGFEWLPKTLPVGVFFEIAPALSFMPETAIFFQGAIGVRYYF